MAAPLVEPVQITEPGVYPDLSHTDYHADPVPAGSLSSTGARMLLPPSCPAKYQHWRRNGQPHKETFDLGQVAHTLVLGDGPKLVVVDADDWRGKAAREQRDAARLAGAVPLLQHNYEQVQAMATAIRQHPIAGALLDPEGGATEQSLFWVDPVTGIWCRARLDYLPHRSSGRMILADYKTCAAADPASISKAVYNHGYHQQADWYLDAALSCGAADDPAFVFVFQEKTPPYVVTVVELDRDALHWGSVLNTKARDVYRECTATGRWPGYTDDVLSMPLPVWAERQYDDARQQGVYDTQEGSIR